MKKVFITTGPELGLLCLRCHMFFYLSVSNLVQAFKAFRHVHLVQVSRL